MTFRDPPDLLSGNCVGLGDVMFPTRHDEILAALWHCIGCDVQQACLEWATQTGEEHGVWGGRYFGGGSR